MFLFPYKWNKLGKEDMPFWINPLTFPVSSVIWGVDNAGVFKHFTHGVGDFHQNFTKYWNWKSNHEIICGIIKQSDKNLKFVQLFEIYKKWLKIGSAFIRVSYRPIRARTVYVHSDLPWQKKVTDILIISSQWKPCIVIGIYLIIIYMSVTLFCHGRAGWTLDIYSSGSKGTIYTRAPVQQVITVFGSLLTRATV